VIKSRESIVFYAGDQFDIIVVLVLGVGGTSVFESGLARLAT